MIRKTILITLVSLLMLAPFGGLVSTCLARGGGGMGGGGMGGGGMGGGGMGGGMMTTGTAGRTTTGTSSTSSSAIVGADSESSVVMVPVPERKWIIVRAPAELMKQIETWIDTFSAPGEAFSTEYDTVTLRYVDATNVADSIMSYLQDVYNNTGVSQGAYVQALTETRQLLIFGKKEIRDLIKKLISELDLPAGMFEREHIQIRFADPEDIKTKIDEYFNYLGQSGGSGSSSTSSSATRTSLTTSRTTSGASTLSANYVSIVVFPSLREITVIASKENMEKVKQLIKEWDQPLDPEKTKPRIITLRNMDPADMVTLLTNLFGSSTTSTSSSGSTSRNTQAMLTSTYGTSADTAAKIVGQLYGKLTFANVTGTRKIIVISNIPEAYDVVASFIKALDTEEVAQTPKIIQLKYADTEDLCRRLNVLFADTGQQAQLTATTTGLTLPSSMSTSSSGSTSSTASTITFPWSSSTGGASSTSTSTLKVSNIYGKARFVPEPSTKSILLLAPEQFLDDLVDLVHELDKAGKQVIIETAIVEVSHEKLGNIGVEFTSGGTLDKGGIFSVGPTANYSSATSGLTKTTSTSGTTATLGLGTLIERGDFTLSGITASTLIDFLVSQADGRVLNQQTLWTKDNTEAQFFKGKTIPIVTGAASSTTSGTTQITYTYTRTAVGMEVRVRPMITPENNVQMIVNVSYSQVAGTDTVSGQTVTSDMKTTTNMVVQNGDALILGGILFQTDQTDVRKIPGLGDIPIIGPILFGHTSSDKSTNELIVFLTPYVIDTAPTELDKLKPETLQQIEDPRERINLIRESLKKSTGELDPDKEKEKE
jgi:type II secretory pathway component GspD/PulD (secretin)